MLVQPVIDKPTVTASVQTPVMLTRLQPPRPSIIAGKIEQVTVWQQGTENCALMSRPRFQTLAFEGFVKFNVVHMRF